MHVLLVIGAGIILLVSLFLFSPRGYFNRKINEAVWWRNQAGRENWVSKPLFGVSPPSPDVFRRGGDKKGRGRDHDPARE